ncbi:MAG: hypothetical protein ABR559_05625 [Gemmatimonadota bacterium]
MMRQTLALGALAMILGLAACSARGEVNTSGAGTMQSWTANVAASGTDGHSGFATASTDGSGETRANVTLTGGSEGGNHPWHIHSGTCGSDGAIVGDPAAYPALRPDPSGNASATATLDVALDPQASYHVNLHQSPTALGTIVGCGELRTSH